MKTYLRYLLNALLLLGMMTGCRKDEFVPPPEGEKVPYVDPNYKSLSETLKASPYQLFLKLYQRSKMDSVLNGRSNHTLLVPGDAAMRGAGYTETSIAAMTTAEADSLVAFFTLRGKYTREELQIKPGNLEGVTLLIKPGINVYPYYFGDGTPSQRADSYYYRHYLVASGDKLLINGLPAGELKNALPASNGYIYPIEKVLPKPVDKTFWEVLANDPRFSMFMEVQQQADELFDTRYRKAFEEAVGYDPGGFGWVDWRRTNYRSTYDIVPDYSGWRQMRFNMLFAPTNEAFKLAGFQTVDEVMAWNEKYATPPEFNWDTYDVKPFGFSSDSVLSYHWDFGRDSRPSKGIDPTPTVFYANDLTNEYLANYAINNRPGVATTIMPFKFGKASDSKPTLQIKDSDAPPATVVETINTIMGPLHVVNRLLIPRNLKMN
jgi:hypothetical protein